jgi:7-carboxy-7-deazaguanine synthase
MPVTLIKSNPEFKKERTTDRIESLEIAELFGNTVQGEGINTGVPATFMRLTNCTLDCIWCDTTSVWKYGNWYTHEEVFELFEQFDLISKFKSGQHLVLTGGSPLKQQLSLVKFIDKFIEKYGFKPYIEVENEVVLKPVIGLVQHVDCWNNSPKLANSEMARNKRLKPDLLEYMNTLPNSWFKLVISSLKDWEEIEEDFLPHISKDRIIVMPCGETREELSQTRELAADVAVMHNLRLTDRLHITIWDKKTSV